MDRMKEEEDPDTVSSFSEGDAIGVNRDELSVPAVFTVRKNEPEVQLAYILPSNMISVEPNRIEFIYIPYIPS
jgi:hypothetical protein